VRRWSLRQRSMYVEVLVSNPFRAGGEALHCSEEHVRDDDAEFQTPSERAVRRCARGPVVRMAILSFKPLQSGR